MKEISYKGKTLKTQLYKQLSDSEYKNIVEEYYKKPNFEVVKKQFRVLDMGGVKNNYIVSYYVKDLMAKVLVYFNKWSIEEVLEYKPLVEFFMGKADKNKNVFPDSMSNCKKLETAFRLCGKGVASKPSNFPIKTADEILNMYNINNNWYDFSCGWGDRLVSALKNNMNYYGTDPNYLLVERLNQLSSDYIKELHKKNIVDIRKQGSESFIPEWENKMGVAFSSPPYFCLEDYKVGKQSYIEGVKYEDWKNNYLKSTIKNIFKYLVKDGYFIININNFKEYNLFQDTIKIAEENGFLLIAEHKLKNIKRVYGTTSKENKGGINDNSEKILVFKKINKDY